MTTDLKPCPFCGSSPKRSAVWGEMVYCDTFGCAVSTALFMIEQWNRRVPVRVKLPGVDRFDNREYKDRVIAALRAQGMEVEP